LETNTTQTDEDARMISFAKILPGHSGITLVLQKCYTLVVVVPCCWLPHTLYYIIFRNAGNFQKLFFLKEKKRKFLEGKHEESYMEYSILPQGKPPPRKLKVGLQIGKRLLITNHLDQSLL
jgi:hypothetical protein